MYYITEHNMCKKLPFDENTSNTIQWCVWRYPLTFWKECVDL